MRTLPSVGVVVPTHHRPELLRKSLEAIQGQDYSGPIQTIVVFDGTEPDTELARSGDRPVTVCRNERTAGLAGARNTGILQLDTDLVAFCDDDDVWAPDKLTAQFEALRAAPAGSMASSAIEVEYEGRRTVRLAGSDRVTHQQLLRSRMSMLHSSTFVLPRVKMVAEVGLIDETIPGSQNEDWDLLLRFARLSPIVQVDRPLVRVLWGRSSFFARRWDTKVASLRWMLEQHPEMAGDARSAARVYGQIAFGLAYGGNRREARRWAARALRRDPRQWRTGVALAVSTGAVSGDQVINALHRFGRGV